MDDARGTSHGGRGSSSDAVRDDTDVRLVWGLSGARAALTDDRVRSAVVVDVLSFSTTVSVATDLDVTVLPHGYDGSAAFALSHGATLARSRRSAQAGEASLSPVSLRDHAAGSGLQRLVLPSPNGSTICEALGDAVQVAAGSLRNAEAVGRWLAEQHGVAVVVAAGEQWPDGSMRPALEDLLGAGAVVAAALTAGPMRRPDPDALAAVAAYHDALPRLRARVQAVPSARELQAMGFGADVDVALELDASRRVPVLRGDSFVAR